MTYPVARLHEELAYIAYHFHWPLGDLLALTHRERLRYVGEISRINTRINSGG
ncbi:DUF6760 family protein [Streptomyces yunnanensis]|uniref:DUF6760 domain-containing protein n=1 Tax=Streptomyces yunnanensis TaxID=156453 RepID=A0A9X8N9X4_9ACTN|nr:DUF6760 family protein [Streptomyces yunnanensis]SHN36549.1 hypothetical protein SAMN05216268_1774 [Streptomyces yunnanensis]